MASAILLKRMHEVETVTFLMTGDMNNKWNKQRVRNCHKLGLPHHVLIAQCFREYVLQPLTPGAPEKRQPCVMCNPRVKFKALMTLASELDCQGIATGHYARVGRKLFMKASCLMMSGAARYQGVAKIARRVDVILPASLSRCRMTRRLFEDNTVFLTVLLI